MRRRGVAPFGPEDVDRGAVDGAVAVGVSVIMVPACPVAGGRRLGTYPQRSLGNRLAAAVGSAGCRASTVGQLVEEREGVSRNQTEPFGFIGFE